MQTDAQRHDLRCNYLPMLREHLAASGIELGEEEAAALAGARSLLAHALLRPAVCARPARAPLEPPASRPAGAADEDEGATGDGAASGDDEYVYDVYTIVEEEADGDLPGAPPGAVPVVQARASSRELPDDR